MPVPVATSGIVALDQKGNKTPFFFVDSDNLVWLLNVRDDFANAPASNPTCTATVFMPDGVTQVVAPTAMTNLNASAVVNGATYPGPTNYYVNLARASQALPFVPGNSYILDIVAVGPNGFQLHKQITLPAAYDGLV